MNRSYALSDDAWQPIKTAPLTPVALWGLDDYDPSSFRFRHAYMMQRGGPDGTEWYCGMKRVYPAYWQHIVSSVVP